MERISKKLLCFFLISLFTYELFAHEGTNLEAYKKVNFTKEELNYIKSKPQINIGMISNFKPFSFIENRLHQGFTVDLLHHISDDTGLTFNIETNSWKNTLNKFKNNELDLISGISHTKKRESFTLFSNPYYEIPIYIFGLKNKTKYKSIEDIRNKKVGISYSMYYKDDLIHNDVKVREYKSSKEKVKALILGDIEYFLASYTSGKKAIVSQSLTSVKPIDEFKDVKKEDLRFGINKNNPILHSIINKSLTNIAQYKIDNLINKWILELEEVDNHRIILSNDEKNFLFEKEKINLCIDPDWMPFEKINEKGQHAGISSDYFKIFQKKINTPIEMITTSSWLESINFIKEKKCDILSLAMRTESREKYLNFSKPYFNTPLVLATKFNIPFVDDLNFLKNKKIGIVKGYAYFTILKKNYPNLNIINISTLDEGLEKVIDGDLFGVVDSLPTIVHKLQNNYLGELKIGAKFNNKWDLSIAINKEYPILVNIFNKLIDSIPENKKQEILNRHVSINYDNPYNYDRLWKIALFIFIIFLFLIYRQYIQKRNNEQLKESFNKIQTILDTTMEGIIISKEGQVTDVNQEFLNLFKYNSKEEVLNKSIIDFIHESQKDEFQRKQKIQFTKPYELKFLKSNSDFFHGLIRGKTIQTKDGNFRISTIMNLTDIKEKEALLVQQSKIATAGEMLENISHQWRQPLSQISTISTGIKIQKEFGMFDDEKLVLHMDNINNSAQYLSQTIEDFKSFLKPNMNTLSTFNLKETIEKLTQLTKDAYEYHNIKIILNVIDCDIHQNENLLIQALLNITNNAKDAILEHNNTKEEESYIFISIKKIDNNAVIKIKDNGKGIDDSIINKIFEPYFTTKHESVGTGIGLYMTYQIITRQMNAEIQVHNTQYQYNDKINKGAEFTIILP